MYKIAVVGDYDSIFGFAALGLDTFAVQTREEAAEKLHQLAQGGYGIIYITEKLAAELTHEIEKYQEVRILVDSLTIPVTFAALGASNAFQLLGTLPKDKSQLLTALDHIIQNAGEEELRTYRTHLPHL